MTDEERAGCVMALATIDPAAIEQLGERVRAAEDQLRRLVSEVRQLGQEIAAIRRPPKWGTQV